MTQLGKCIAVHRDCWEILSSGKKYRAIINNKYENIVYPVVGDVVSINIDLKNQSCIILDIQPRTTELYRNKDGHKKTIAANIDVVFITTSMNKEFNVGKLERLLIMVNQSGAKPCFVLTKADICKNPNIYIEQIKRHFSTVPYVVTSSLNEQSIELLKTMWNPGETAIFVGSSGVGKTTLINTLLGYQVGKVYEVREKDDKGRHTTTSSIYLELPDGRKLIDSPGIRSVGLLNLDFKDINEVFSFISENEKMCQYKNCTHTNENGCRIIELLNEGIIDEDDYRRYLKMKRQILYDAQKSGIDNRADWEKRRDLLQKKKKYRKRR